MILAYPAEVTRPNTGYAPLVARPIIMQSSTVQPAPNSIFQPTQTTSDVIRTSLQQSDYIAPGQTPLPQNPAPDTVTLPSPLILGLEPNTFWLLLLIIGAILIAVVA